MNNLTETNRKVLAIVPARGGSKSIPRKNIKLFNGYPLIAYSIVAGHRAKSVNRIIVSTDDPNIAAIARDYDAEVPFLRPAELGRDDTPDLPVFEHALCWLDTHEGYRPDIIVQLRPTSPLRPVKCVDEAVSLLLNNPLADSLRAVTPSGQNPYKMWRIQDEFLIPIIKSEIYEPYNIPRQELPQTFWQTGHVDVIRYETIVKKHSMVGEHIMPLIIDSTYATDLDTLEDWEFAEWILSHRNLDIVRPGNTPSFLSAIRELCDLIISVKKHGRRKDV
jgi:N-acylneuraminate cytidylyltransferase